MRYEDFGVSAGKEEVHRAIRGLDEGLYPDTFCKILPDYLTGDAGHCLLMHADGAGTKAALAYAYWKTTGDASVWAGIAQDALVMNLDDMACAGATSGFVVSSTIGRHKGRIPEEVLTALIEGTHQFLSDLGAFGIEAHLAGGETADLGDTVRTLVVDATATARLPRGFVRRIDLQPGQVIVGLASDGQTRYEKHPNAGIGSNGLTLARHALLHAGLRSTVPETIDDTLPLEHAYRGPYALTDPLPDSTMSVGKALLSPTRTYLPFLHAFLPLYRKQLGGIVHCTGGGQTKVGSFIKRPLRVVKDHLRPIPPLFQRLHADGGIDWREMYRVFNMGHRLELYTDEATAQKALDMAREWGIEGQVIGRVEEAERPALTIHGPDGPMEYPLEV